MKVQDLLTNMNNKEFNIEQDLDVKKYLPIEVKKAVAQGILYECTDNEDGVAKIDSVQKYLAYIRYMITMHTNLEYTDEDYDVLCSTEYCGISLLNAIMECFNEDAKECADILSFVTEDYLREIGAEFAITQFLNGLNKSLGDISAKINQKLDEIDVKDMIPNDADKEQLSTFLKKYIK